ncbi:hypothetical protein BgAZ_208550 [Babesia gibsoni]|uniref:Uncharacterized protein n=1 Tax=Babesia gibsoni TaxID=33632 RepID=A0AAD8PEU4_BABGI|nr:hypothetical protein BgAZ_208550 [Babesia gibsoni]
MRGCKYSKFDVKVAYKKPCWVHKICCTIPKSDETICSEDNTYISFDEINNVPRTDSEASISQDTDCSGEVSHIYEEICTEDDPSYNVSALRKFFGESKAYATRPLSSIKSWFGNRKSLGPSFISFINLPGNAASETEESMTLDDIQKRIDALNEEMQALSVSDDGGDDDDVYDTPYLDDNGEPIFKRMVIPSAKAGESSTDSQAEPESESPVVAKAKAKAKAKAEAGPGYSVAGAPDLSELVNDTDSANVMKRLMEQFEVLADIPQEESDEASDEEFQDLMRRLNYQGEPTYTIQNGKFLPKTDSQAEPESEDPIVAKAKAEADPGYSVVGAPGGSGLNYDVDSDDAIRQIMEQFDFLTQLEPRETQKRKRDE